MVEGLLPLRNLRPRERPGWGMVRGQALDLEGAMNHPPRPKRAGEAEGGQGAATSLLPPLRLVVMLPKSYVEPLRQSGRGAR